MESTHYNKKIELLSNKNTFAQISLQALTKNRDAFNKS